MYFQAAKLYGMKRIVIAFLFSFSLLKLSAQHSTNAPVRLTENSVVKDTTGTEYPYTIWQQLMTTGRYMIKPEKPTDPNTAFFIIRLSDEDYAKRINSLPKPPESKYFKTGSKFSSFKTTDINGNKINTKNLAGKIIVLNFWFINCPPCVREIPELHKLAESYKTDSSVVFIAVALDQAADIREFLKTHPFGYSIVDNGRYISNQYSINSYPTNAVVSPEGKVYFHSSGFGMSTVHWIKKSIEELQQQPPKKEEAVAAQ